MFVIYIIYDCFGYFVYFRISSDAQNFLLDKKFDAAQCELF